MVMGFHCQPCIGTKCWYVCICFQCLHTYSSLFLLAVGAQTPPPAWTSSADCVFFTQNTMPSTVTRMLYRLSIPLGTSILWLVLATSIALARRSKAGNLQFRGVVHHVEHDTQVVLYVVIYTTAPVVYGVAFIGLACYSSTGAEFLVHEPTVPLPGPLSCYP